LSRSWLPSDYYPRNRSHNDAEQGSNDRRQNPRPPLFLHSFHLLHDCLHPVRDACHCLLRMPEQPSVLRPHPFAGAQDLLSHNRIELIQVSKHLSRQRHGMGTPHFHTFGRNFPDGGFQIDL
jgi:hypothetical protein